MVDRHGRVQPPAPGGPRDERDVFKAAQVFQCVVAVSVQWVCDPGPEAPKSLRRKGLHKPVSGVNKKTRPEYIAQPDWSDPSKPHKLIQPARPE
jgi:hypothetical protein